MIESEWLRDISPQRSSRKSDISDISVTFDDQRNNGVGDAVEVARHTAVGTVVDRADIADGDNRTVGADLNIICRTQTQL